MPLLPCHGVALQVERHDGIGQPANARAIAERVAGALDGASEGDQAFCRQDLQVGSDPVQVPSAACSDGCSA